jgi:hypothetical protein
MAIRRKGLSGEPVRRMQAKPGVKAAANNAAAGKKSIWESIKSAF